MEISAFISKCWLVLYDSKGSHSWPKVVLLSFTFNKKYDMLPSESGDELQHTKLRDLKSSIFHMSKGKKQEQRTYKE